MNKQQPDSGIHATSAHCPRVYRFSNSRPHSSREKCDENFQWWKLERKKNEQIKGWISSSSLIRVHMIHPPTVHVCTKFQPSRLTVPEKNVTKNSKVWKVNWTWRFHNMSTENLIRPQGHVTPKWLIRSGRNSNSSEILCLSWLPASLTKIRSTRGPWATTLTWMYRYDGYIQPKYCTCCMQEKSTFRLPWQLSKFKSLD